ncbi:MAG: LuxR C-terminal-related transcriptional regulator [Fimbriimonadaceae bacterium]|nr:LuxR C-terminal-related transcriptional regulator [Fimbriimonadaceae bacterium]
MSDAIAALLSRTGGFDVVFNIGHLLKMVEIIESEMPDLVIFTEEFDAPDSRAHIRRMRESTDVPTMLLHAQNRQDLGADVEFDVVQSRWAGTGALLDAIRGLGGTGGGQNGSDRPPAVSNIRDDTIIRQLAKMSLSERNVAHCIAKGMPNKEIAETLGLSEPTIKLYVGRLLRGFDCKNRVQLALKLHADGHLF